VRSVDDRPTTCSEGDHGDGEDPEVLSFDVDTQVINQSCHLHREVRGLDVESGDQCREVPVLDLECLDLVDELARCRRARKIPSSSRRT
jgi:hypothetical protein